jgi:hypothetical protein
MTKMEVLGRSIMMAALAIRPRSHWAAGDLIKGSAVEALSG